MNEELPQFINELGKVSSEARSNFGSLSTEQLNWKPSTEEWSVAQCLEHLIVTNKDYFPIIEKIARGDYKPKLQQRLPLLPSLFGSLILKVVQPQSKRKFKAGKAFQPSSSEISGDIVSRFEQHNKVVAAHMMSTERFDLRKIIITSPIGPFATYSLLAGYRIVVAHEQRHLAQAKRVTEREGFPK
jgi:hypothetical protein